MFERYAAKARKAIFFARYASSQNGMPDIGTPSVLWGVLWEDEELLLRLLPTAGPEELNRLRADVDGLLPKRSLKVPTGVDLPLSQAAQRALAYAAGEAERRRHEFIEPRHLLWGLLTESGPETACLKSHLITVAAVNADLSRIPSENSARRALRRLLAAIPESRLEAAVTILDGLSSRSFSVSGTAPNGAFSFSFDDDTK